MAPESRVSPSLSLSRRGNPSPVGRSGTGESSPKPSMKRVILLSTVLFIVLVSTAASAYQTASPVADPCHERLTERAVGRARAEGLVPALVPTEEEAALVDDLPYPPGDRYRDLAVVTLVLGNRYLDFKGNEPLALDELVQVHSDPEDQREHCLRRPEDDAGSGGAQSALNACRRFIRDKVEASLDGLDEMGRPDPTKRSRLKIVLSIRGSVEVALPTVYVELGHALHTLQDGFSHTLRQDDFSRPVDVLNYLEQVEGRLEPEEDGIGHLSPLDACTALDDYRQERMAVAELATLELIRAALAPAANRAERMTRVDEVLDTYFVYRDGCDVSNDWCDAPELAYRNTGGCGCHLGGDGSPRGGWALLLLGGVLLLRRKAAIVGLIAILMPASAWAQAPSNDETEVSAESLDEEAEVEMATEDAPDEPSEQGAARCPDGSEPLDTSMDSPSRPEPFPLGMHIGFAGAVTNAGFAASLGARYRFGSHFILGLDGEINPWIGTARGNVQWGTTNIYATFIGRVPMAFESINLRSTLHVGMSRMNFDLFGVPRGTIGPYVGFNLLGLDWELSRSVYLVLDPADISIPIPQTSGVPFAYPQYRVNIGIQIGS